MLASILFLQEQNQAHNPTTFSTQSIQKSWHRYEDTHTHNVVKETSKLQASFYIKPTWAFYKVQKIVFHHPYKLHSQAWSLRGETNTSQV